MITTEEILGYEPCYSEKRILELWAGRPSLSPKEVAELDILKHDRVWALCHCLAHRDLDATLQFSRSCRVSEIEDPTAKGKTKCAANSTYSVASTAAAGAIWWADTEVYWAQNGCGLAAARAAYDKERQRQIDELVAALDVYSTSIKETNPC